MKKYLVGSTLGEGFLHASRWVALKTVPLKNPEKAGLIANAILVFAT